MGHQNVKPVNTRKNENEMKTILDENPTAISNIYYSNLHRLGLIQQDVSKLLPGHVPQVRQ